MSTNEKLANEWNKVGLNVTTVRSGAVFYSGIRASSPIHDPFSLMKMKHSAWLSQSAYWAGEYCYREVEQYPYRALIKTSLHKDIVVVEFPSSFHPADAFFEWEFKGGKFEVDYSSFRADMECDGDQPDHHIDKHFLNIASLAGYQDAFDGYIRKAEDDRLGAKPGEIVELSLINQSVLSLDGAITPPEERSSFREKIGPDLSMAGVELFNRA